jgi:GxxExxY protein
VPLNLVALAFHSRASRLWNQLQGSHPAHSYYADFVVWNKILFEAKAVEKLTDSHIKQVLNYLATSKPRLGLLVNFGGDSLEWKRLVL